MQPADRRYGMVLCRRHSPPSHRAAEPRNELPPYAQSGAGALLISGDALFLHSRTQLVALCREPASL
jgi:hypothetical protein